VIFSGLRYCKSRILIFPKRVEKSESFGRGSLFHEREGELSFSRETHVHSEFAVFPQSCSLLGHEHHPPPHHTYFTVSTVLILNFEVGEKYIKTSSENPGEKSSTLSNSTPQTSIFFVLYIDFSKIQV